jgi:hypothetical protein
MKYIIGRDSKLQGAWLWMTKACASPGLVMYGQALVRR